MLTYPLDQRSDLPIYKYLYQCIRDDILSGAIACGEKLPSKRKLAEHLSVSVITVQNAYELLQLEGYIGSKEKSGYFVLHIDEGIPVIPPAPPSSSRSSRAASGAYGDRPDPVSSASAPPATTQTAPSADWFADLASSTVLAQDFPITAWSKAVRRVLKTGRDYLVRSAPGNGLLELRQAIASHLLKFRGIPADPEQIIVGSGTEQLYSLIVRILGSGRTYGLEDPGYSKIRHCLDSLGEAVHPLPIDESGLRPPLPADGQVDVLHLSPAHHFPTGIIMPAGRRRELLSWLTCPGTDRWLVEDDYDCELRLRGRPVSPLFTLDTSGRVIYMNTFTRTLSPAFRVAYLVLPHRLLDQYHERLAFHSSTVPNLDQLALAHFINEGDFERHIRRVRTAARDRRRLILQAIRQSDMADLISIEERDAGLHFMIRIKKQLPPGARAAIKEAAKRHGIRVTMRDDYRASACTGGDVCLVIVYAGLAPELCEEAIRRLSAAVVEVVRAGTGTVADAVARR